MVCHTVIWKKVNLTFAQYIVFTGEMYESAVKDNAEDFPKVNMDFLSLPLSVLKPVIDKKELSLPTSVIKPVIDKTALSLPQL